MKSSMLPAAAAVAVAAVLVGTAVAAKPGTGSSTGFGSVFVSNPVQSLGDESLTDQKDSDAAVPAAAYHDVTLTNLDGSGFLSGDYAKVVSETGNPAYSPTNTFRYTRHQDEFEQVMAYYWITQAQRYIQSLGFGESRRGINNRPQPVRINQWGADNSFATDHPKNELRFGKGGVDDAEDAEVILHEYGHAIHFAQNFSFASEEAGAISEGFGDYWAVTVSDVVARSLGVPSASRCRASPTGTRRRTRRRCRTACGASTRTCTTRQDLNGEVHHDGQIWSRALWDIRQALGNVKADTIILQGSFDFPGDDDDRPREPHRRGRAVALRQERRERRHAGVRGPRDPVAGAWSAARGDPPRPAHQVLCASTPPSTTRFAPVIQRAAGEARKRTASATSAGVPSRSSGAAACQRATPSGHASSRPGASIRPGETQFTRMPAPPSSSAAARVCMTTAAFAAA